MMNNTKKYCQYNTKNIVADFMVKTLCDNSYDTIIDSGVGNGVFIEKILENDIKFDKIIGVEIDNKYCKKLREKYKDNDDIKIVNKDYLDFNHNANLIIGNPPYCQYVNIPKNIRKSLKENFKNYYNGKWNLYYAFIMKSINNLKESGDLIYITPFDYFYSTNANSLRKFIMKKGYYDKIFHTNEYKLFENVSVNSMIFKYIKNQQEKDNNINVVEYNTRKGEISNLLDKSEKFLKLLSQEKNIRIKNDNFNVFNQKQFNKNGWQWHLANKKDEKIIQKVEQESNKVIPKIRNGFETYNAKKLIKKEDAKKYYNMKNPIIIQQNNTTYWYNDKDKYPYTPLSTICDVNVGSVSGREKIFRINNINKNINIEKECIKKFVKAKSCKRYNIGKTFKYIYIPDFIDSEKKLKRKYPNTYNFLKKNEKNLNQRYKKIPFFKWLTIRNKKKFKENSNKCKIFVPTKDRHNKFRFSLTRKNVWGSSDVLMINKKRKFQKREERLYYILAWLNSKFVKKWFLKKGPKKGNKILFKQNWVEKIPIRLINMDNSKEKEIYKNITSFSSKCVNIPENKKYFEKKINEEFEKLLNI
ncbi:MAG: Eco57I restriction-modification methylase domain-containing protein [archaeon]